VSFHNAQKVLESTFSIFGVPLEYKTDNGSPFQSHDFAEYARQRGFKHRRITPLWPRANAEVEAFMKNLGKVLKTAEIEKRNTWQAVQTFLQAYRETPHSSTGVPPALLMLSYRRNTGIPGVDITPQHAVALHKQAVSNDAKAKARMKDEYDVRMRTKNPTIVVGNSVLVRRKTFNKSTSPWDPNPYEVTSVKGSMITAERTGQNAHTITRNSSHFKRVGGLSGLELYEADNDHDSSEELTNDEHKSAIESSSQAVEPSPAAEPSPATEPLPAEHPSQTIVPPPQPADMLQASTTPGSSTHTAAEPTKRAGRPIGSTKAANKAATEARQQEYQAQRRDNPSIRVQQSRHCK
jgi:chemotaxis protein histidine kinase CheA